MSSLPSLVSTRAMSPAGSSPTRSMYPRPRGSCILPPAGRHAGSSRSSGCSRPEQAWFPAQDPLEVGAPRRPRTCCSWASAIPDFDVPLEFGELLDRSSGAVTGTEWAFSDAASIPAMTVNCLRPLTRRTRSALACPTPPRIWCARRPRPLLAVAHSMRSRTHSAAGPRCGPGLRSGFRPSSAVCSFVQRGAPGWSLPGLVGEDLDRRRSATGFDDGLVAPTGPAVPGAEPSRPRRCSPWAKT